MLSIPIILVLFLGITVTSSAYAQIEAGGVSSDTLPQGTTWYAGEGLEKGDFFSYSTCFVDYKECTNFQMDFWIKGDKIVGSETKWLSEVVVYDGNKIIVGEMELGKIAPEPTGGTPELGVYRGAFKSSIAWLSAFATSDGSSGGKGPKAFSEVSWGKIGNIGGQQVIPLEIETITVPAGTWETVVMSWKTGGAVSKVWIADDFPFPIKAKTYTHVAEGIPPPEYDFKLLKYENRSDSPFVGIKSTVDELAAAGCNTDIERNVIHKRSSDDFKYQVHVFYGPEDPVVGCDMQWLVNFLKFSDETEFLNQVQYDILVLDDEGKVKRSIANENGESHLYS
ncbi:MAG: peptidase, partial [Nitrosopumilus sp. BACL13 MAG-121220-bin23]